MAIHENINIPLFNVKHDYFKNSFFPSTIIEWSNLYSKTKNSESLAIFKKSILAFIRRYTNTTFHCHNSKGLKLIKRLGLGSRHLRFHKFKHSFQDTLNPICNCGTAETIIHYLFHFLIFQIKDYFKVSMIVFLSKTTPTLQLCFSLVSTHLIM